MTSFLSKIALLLVLFLVNISSSLAFGARPLRVMPLGDSLTAGGYFTDGSFKTGAGYRFTLWKLLRDAGYSTQFVGSMEDGPQDFPEAHHEGHSGKRIDQVLAETFGWVSSAQPDVVLLLIGTNDAIQNYEFSDAVARVGRLVEEVQAAAPQSEIILSTTIANSQPDVEARVVTFNRNLTAWIATKEKVDSHLHFVDMYAASGIRSGLIGGIPGGPSDLIDGVHPTPKGYDAMARVWFQALQSLIPHLSRPEF